MHSRPALPADLSQSVERIKARWHGGARPNAAAELRRRPELLSDQSLAIDLIYEEYCALEERGEVERLDSFCDRFPASLRPELLDVLRAHRMLAAHMDQLAPAPGDNWPAPGSSVGGVEIETELARGTYTRVYRASDPETARQVVVKLSTRQTAEAQILGQLTHPHVISVLWAGWVGPWHAIITPWFGPVTLRQVIDQARTPPTRPRAVKVRYRLPPATEPPAPAEPRLTLPPEFVHLSTDPVAIATLGAQLADALTHLHARRIVHCDVKPSNVLIAPGVHPYLIDFDKAAPLGEVPMSVVGTLPYMAPERLRTLADGEDTGHTVAPPADIYALGVTLYEALTGRLPFLPIGWTATLREVAFELLQDCEEEKHPPVEDLAPCVPPWLGGVVDDCLSVDPARRPKAKDLASRLLVPAEQPRGFFGRVLAIAAPLVALVSRS